MAQQYVHQFKIKGPEGSWTFTAPVGETTIGRQVGNDLHLEHPLVSRRHAVLNCTPQLCRLSDLGSANGTAVDGEKLADQTPVELANGATIQMGPFELTYEQVPVAAPKPPAEKKKPPPPPKVEKKKSPAKPPKVKKEKKPPPSPPRAAPPPPPPPVEGASPGEPALPGPGLATDSSRYLQYLPGIYHTDFMNRFLAIFEATLAPIEWNVDNFDLFLNPKTTPEGFLPWLANWFEVTFDPTWQAAQRRTLLTEAHQIFARRGTRWALSRVLEIYTGLVPEIIDLEEDQDDFTFSVKIPLTEGQVDRALIEQIIDKNKPAHASYRLLFKKR